MWAAVAASAAYWGLRLFVTPRPVPAAAVVAPAAAPPRGDLARLLGSDAEPITETAEATPTSGRFQLVGVVAPRRESAMHEGVALIAVDGKPARAYRVGAVVDGETVLQSVRARGASLGPRGGEARVSLDIPPPAAAATGTLPSAGAAAPPPTVPVLPPPQPAQPVPGAPQAQGGVPPGAPAVSARVPGALPPGAVRPTLPGVPSRAMQSSAPAEVPPSPPSPPHQQVQ